MNPNSEQNPAGSAVTTRAGQLDWQISVAPRVALSASYPAPSATLAAGRRYEFPVTLKGRFTGGTDTPGYRQFDVTVGANRVRANDQGRLARRCWSPEPARRVPRQLISRDQDSIVQGSAHVTENGKTTTGAISLQFDPGTVVADRLTVRGRVAGILER